MNLYISNSICRNLTSSWIEQWNSYTPDVPLCNQYFYEPVGILLYSVFCLTYISWLWKQKLQKRTLTLGFIFKIVIIILLVCIQMIEFLMYIIKGNPYDSVAFVISNISISISLIIMLLMLHFERLCDAQNSGFYFIYWVILSCLYVIRLRSSVLSMKKTDMVKSILIFSIINFPLCIVALLLSCFSDKRKTEQRKVLNKSKEKVVRVPVDNDVELQKEGQSMEMKDALLPNEEKIVLNQCPEKYASFISRISFTWFTPLVWRGFKKPLIHDNLWKLNEEDQCSNVSAHFHKYLNRYLLSKLVSKSSEKLSKTELAINNNTNFSPSEANQTDRLLTVDAAGDEKFNSSNGADKFMDQKIKAETENENNKGQNVKNKEKKEKFDPGLLYAILRANIWPLLVSGLFKLVYDCMVFLGPILLKLLLNFVSSDDKYIWHGYFFAIMLFTTALINEFILHQYFHYVYKIGMHIRSGLISAIYRKSLVLSSAARKDTTVGEIVNHMSVDSQKFLELTSYVHIIWSGPLQIIVSMIMLWKELGPSVLGGIAVMLLLIPINVVVGNITRQLQTKQLKVSDERIKMMNEILNGIKILKMYAWENSFIKFVMDIRDRELSYMKKGAFLGAVTSFTFTCAPVLVSLTSFGIYVLVSSENILNAEKIFVSLSLFNIIRFPLMMLPMIIANLIQAYVSLKRLTSFMKRPEIDKSVVHGEDIPGMAVKIDNCSFCWDPSDSEPVLKNINFEVAKGTLMGVVGPVGAGKSSLLSAILGELHLINRDSGRVNVKGSIAYVPQQAWIINATLRDNIIFGRPFDACKYAKILEACCLAKDLEILSHSDMTEIGENGINLSGGQKQRVSLARACYSEADIYLFDDPLSAVDSHVAKALMSDVLGPEGLLKERTRILATHSLTVLPQCDNITVMLDSGCIGEKGNYCNLIGHNGAFAKYVTTHLFDVQGTGNCADDDEKDMEERKKLLEDIEANLDDNSRIELKTQLERSKSILSKSRESLHSLKSLKEVENEMVVKRRKRDSSICRENLEKLGVKDVGVQKKLIEEETSQVGQVKMRVYMIYIRSVGLWLSSLILFLYLVNQSITLMYNLWLVRWSSQAEKSSNMSEKLQFLKENFSASQSEISYLENALANSRNLYLGVYGSLALCQGGTQLINSLIFAIGIVSAAKVLHGSLLISIMRSPLSMFETVPTGRILNRFSGDLTVLAHGLPHFMNGFMLTFFNTIAVLIMVILPNAWIALPLAFIVVVYLLMQRFYIATSRQLKRLDSVSKSPIYSHFGESLQGVTSIRAYGLENRFINASEAKVDTNLYAYYPSVVSNRWLAIILETLGNVIVFLAAMFSVISRHIGLDIDPGIVGLSVSYALSIIQIMNWLVRMSSEVESNIVSVERIDEYCKMSPEAEWEIKDKKPDDDWPMGNIEFDKYSTRYREGLDFVLKEIDLKIKSGERIGIVGRTGSGKSSLVLSLFRILERVEGEIRIDGIPIHEIGLHDLRGRLTVIPQDPVLFSGSLRRNIDPLGIKSNDEIWKALEEANVADFIRSSGKLKETNGDGLEMSISEGGENLSVGQRQLVCLARALLRRTRILVLDEATASVDLNTDSLIQKTIRSSKFSQCTILTIAHRLNTVLDYDRILVLDNGRVAELDSPKTLLADNKSIFFSMAKDANLVHDNQNKKE